MSKIKLLNFFVDEDQFPGLDDHQTCVENFQEFFDVPEDKIEDFADKSVETGAYIFIKVEGPLDNVVQEIKEECNYEEDSRQDVSEQFDQMYQQFKNELKRYQQFTLFTWSLECDRNILAVILD